MHNLGELVQNCYLFSAASNSSSASYFLRLLHLALGLLTNIRRLKCGIYSFACLCLSPIQLFSLQFIRSTFRTEKQRNVTSTQAMNAGLIDAKLVGGEASLDCTLILTEGNSAKSFAVSCNLMSLVFISVLHIEILRNYAIKGQPNIKDVFGWESTWDGMVPVSGDEKMATCTRATKHPKQYIV